jgi:hypothetical protein
VTAGLVVSYTEPYLDAIMFIVIKFLIQAAVELRGVIGIKW